jgi:hypothetical protein
MTFNIWVSRLSASHGGAPSRSCPISLNRKQIKENVYRFRKTVSPLNCEPSDCEIVSENSIRDNLIVELFEKGKLRQGWGMTYENMNTDLRQDLNDWVANYLNLIWKLCGDKRDCSFACARYEILNQMRFMEKDDIIFIPRTPYYSMFTVSTVKEKYKFEPIDGYVEFGHVIEVNKKNTLAFQYEDFMPAKIFNPYQKAVSEVKEHHQNYLTIKKFIDEVYLNVLEN